MFLANGEKGSIWDSPRCIGDFLSSFKKITAIFLSLKSGKESRSQMSNEFIIYKFHLVVSNGGRKANNVHELREKRKKRKESMRVAETHRREHTLANPRIFRKMEEKLNCYPVDNFS